MIRRLFFGAGLLLTLHAVPARAQGLYFPPATGEWETRSPEMLGWNSTALPDLRAFLDREKTKAFIVLKDGRIAMEWYFGTFTADSVWYWASAGKSLTAFTAGVAIQEGRLNPDAATSAYLGRGWSSTTAAQEDRITVRHQLTMTSGLNDGVPDNHCTTPACLQFLADPGSRWAYHNAPYTLLDPVLEAATGMTLNQFLISRVRNPAGMRGAFFKQGYNNLYISDARSAARFGLLVLNRGTWNGTAILRDTAYFRRMVTPSQNLNPSYGYLWWLNGQSAFMVPGSQLRFPGMLVPEAPADLFSAIGKNGQIISVVPSAGLVVVRLGENADNAEVPFVFLRNLWQQLMPVLRTSTAMPREQNEPLPAFAVYPNPAGRQPVTIQPEKAGAFTAEVFTLLGQRVALLDGRTAATLPGFAPGLYLIRFRQNGQVSYRRLTVL